MNRVLIVGAGLAGLRVAERLRRSGYDQRLTLLGAEAHLPYDRPPLSKGYLTGAEPTWLRAAERWAGLDVDLRLGEPARALDLDAGEVLVDDGAIAFDQLVIATGVRARNVAAWSGPGVHVLRTLDDARAFRRALHAARRLVVIGAGVLGSEVAASARTLGLAVDLVDPLPTPLGSALPGQLGRAIASLHEARGVRLHLGRGVTAVEATEVSLDDGTVLDADLVLVAVGSVPNVDWLTGSDLALGAGVPVDPTLMGSDPRVSALGDVAEVVGPDGSARRVEHWDNAVSSAAVVAANILREPADREPITDVPYFWTDQYDLKIQVYGAVSATDRWVVLDGRPEEGRFLAAHLDPDGGLVGLSAAGDPGALNRAKRALTERWDVDALVAAAPWALSGNAAAPRS